MADSILRLKVESSEYDAKLKKAAEGIRHLADVAHKSGGELTGLEKSELDYIKALGDMETKSRTASGQVRELTNTYKELKVVYDQLNDVEKADEGGKALAASLDRLRQRAQEAKSSLDNASKSIETQGGFLDSLKDKLVINIDAIKLFNVGLSAAKGALDVAKDAFFANETQLDEWGRVVQSSESLYNGFLNALNTGDISGYLNSIDDIVNSARDAYDALDQLSTFNAFTRGSRAGLRSNYSEALNEYKLNPTAENKKRLTEANAALVSGMQQQADKIRYSYEKSLNSLGVDRLLKGQRLEDFKNLFRSGNYEELERLKAGYSQGKMMNAGAQYWYGDRVYDGKIQDRSTGVWRTMDESEKKQFEFARVLAQVNDKQIDSIQALDEQYKNVLDSINNQNRSYNRLSGNNRRLSGGGGRAGNTTDTLSKIVFDENKAMLSGVKAVDTMPSVWSMADKNAMRSSMNGWNDIGTFLGIPPSIWDALRKQTGLGYQQFDPNKDISKQWKLNKKGQLTDGKDAEQDEKNQANMIQGIETINTSLQSIFGGIEKLGFEIPQELNNIFGVIQTIVGIVSAIQTLSTVKLFGFAGGGIAHAANGFIGGNAFSGDQIPIMVNSGELILNKAQQGNLASQMSGGGLSQLQLEAIVSGEDLRFIINSNGRRTGRGEIVTTNFR